MNDTIATAIIAAISAGGGVAVKGFWDTLRARQTGSSDREAHTEGRLWERVESLESRADNHDKYCDEKIAAALAKSEAECDEKLTRKLAAQAAQLRRELKRGLEESTNE